MVENKKETDAGGLKQVGNTVLIKDIREMIQQARSAIASSVNTGLTLLYWRIGQRICIETLGGERAKYGKQIIVSLARELSLEYGQSFAEKNLRRMIQFAEVFNDKSIVVSLVRQLSWTHFLALIPLKDDVQRDFYAQMCRVERWSVRTLRKKIDSMLYERTALSHKPEELARQELKQLQESDQLIVCSDYMQKELISTFDLPESKIVIIPNGIEPSIN
ncbi:MAG: DUF1016 N-terminal domain-containing protein, partial [Candidatus Thorarchaeota archaeon]